MRSLNKAAIESAWPLTWRMSLTWLLWPPIWPAQLSMDFLSMGHLHHSEVLKYCHVTMAEPLLVATFLQRLMLSSSCSLAAWAHVMASVTAGTGRSPYTHNCEKKGWMLEHPYSLPFSFHQNEIRNRPKQRESWRLNRWTVKGHTVEGKHPQTAGVKDLELEGTWNVFSSCSLILKMKNWGSGSVTVKGFTGSFGKTDHYLLLLAGILLSVWKVRYATS